MDETAKEESIDFNKLQREFYTAKEADRKYWRENEAKFRAVNQKVGSYEEFRDMVTASHLTPLDRGDITGVKGTPQPWNSVVNSVSSRQGDTENKEFVLSSIATPSVSSITTRDDFLKGWSSAIDKTAFILSFDISFIESIFKYDIPFDFIETTVRTMLKDVPSIEIISKIVNVFRAIARCERFALAVKFLGKGDKENIKRLFDEFERMECSTVELMALYQV